jgi:chemotaxis protein MotB
MKKKVEESMEPTAPFWMVTYGDMVTLLLTFFILLISFSNMDEIKFNAAAKSLQGALGVLEDHKMELQLMQEAPGGEDDLLIRTDIYEQLQEFEREMANEIDQGDITVDFVKNGLMIQMGSKLLFDVADASLNQKSQPILMALAKTIKENAAEVLVGGHTDNVPINTPEFQSNWELSGARAMSVVRYLIDEGGVPPKILAATAYGEYRPIVPNASPEDQQINRRVEFLVTWR